MTEVEEYLGSEPELKWCISLNNLEYPTTWELFIKVEPRDTGRITTDYLKLNRSENHISVVKCATGKHTDPNIFYYSRDGGIYCIFDCQQAAEDARRFLVEKKFNLPKLAPPGPGLDGMYRRTPIKGHE